MSRWNALDKKLDVIVYRFVGVKVSFEMWGGNQTKSDLREENDFKKRLL